MGNYNECVRKRETSLETKIPNKDSEKIKRNAQLSKIYLDEYLTPRQQSLHFLVKPSTMKQTRSQKLIQTALSPAKSNR